MAGHTPWRDITHKSERSLTGWHPFEGGTTIATKGSESGRIARDEEHDDGARVTFEEDGTAAPFTATCGVYGWMVHTIHFDDRGDADRRWDELRGDLAALAVNPGKPGAMTAFVDRWSRP